MTRFPKLLIPVAAGLALIAGAGPSMTLTPAAAAPVTPIQTYTDEELHAFCVNQCYVQYTGDMAPCRRLAERHGTGSFEYEICQLYAQQPYDACLQQCDAAYPGS